MKKIFLGSAFLLSALFFSCKKENALTENAVTEKGGPEQQTLNFKSNAEMEKKMNAIAVLKNVHEAEIAQKILFRNGLSIPSINTSGAPSGSINKEALMQDLKFYHTERLKAIYKLREELNFTSLQSIADEINSLSLLNPGKANELYLKYASLLKKTAFGVSTNYDERLAAVLNLNGDVLMNSKKMVLNSTVAGRYIGQTVKQGFVANNGLFAITYAAGVEYHQDDIGNAFQKKFTQLAGYINAGSGFVLYPTWFYTNSGSVAWFAAGLVVDPINFPTGANTVIRNESAVSVTSSNGSWTLVAGMGGVSGTFVTVVNGQYISVAGAVAF